MNTPSLPVVTALLGGVGTLLAGAAPDVAIATTPAGFHLTGNPTIDALIVAGVVMPAMASLGWGVKATVSAFSAGTVAGLRAAADFVERRAKASKETGDDGPATAFAAFARAFANALERADSPRKLLTPGVVEPSKGEE